MKYSQHRPSWIDDHKWECKVRDSHQNPQAVGPAPGIQAPLTFSIKGQ